MDGQLSFASLDFASKTKRMKRDVFLAEMAAVVPWPALEAIIEPQLSQGWPAGRSAAVSDRGDVAHLLSAAVV